MSSTITAGAGEHYVAYCLASLGYISALVRQGSPTIDVLASDTTGSRTIGIQVKTTQSALRTRGRGDNKVPHELQFPLGHHAIEKGEPGTVICFVDIKGKSLAGAPDVYVMPVEYLLFKFSGIDVRQWSYFRLHWPIADMEPFKNNWSPVIERLGTAS